MQFLHNGINLLVVQCALFVFEDEVHGVTLLAFRQVFTCVNVEELYLLQQFLLGLACNLCYLCKLNVFVYQQRSRLTDGNLLNSLNSILFFLVAFISSVQFISA